MLVNQVLLVSDVRGQHIRPKHICQLNLPRQREQHDLLRNAEKTAVGDCARRCRAKRLTGYGIFANKIRITQNVEDCFLSGLGLHAHFDASFLNDKQRFSGIPLGEDCLSLPEGDQLPADPDGRQKGFRVEGASLLDHSTTALPLATLQWTAKRWDDAQYCSQLPWSSSRRYVWRDECAQSRSFLLTLSVAVGAAEETVRNAARVIVVAYDRPLGVDTYGAADDRARRIEGG